MKWEILKRNLSKDMANYSSEVDVDQIWSGIEGQVDGMNAEGKNRKFAFLLIFLLGIGVLGGGIFLGVNNQNSSSITEGSEIESINSDLVQTVESHNDQGSNLESLSLQSPNASIVAELPGQSTNVKHNEEKSINDRSTIPTLAADNASNGKVNIIKKHKTLRSDKNKAQPVNSLIANPIHSIGPSAIDNAIETNRSDRSDVLLMGDANQPSAGRKRNVQQDMVSIAALGPMLLEHDNVPPNDQLDLQYAGNVPGELANRFKFIDANRKGFDLFAEVYGGYSYPKKFLSAKDNSAEDEYYQFRKESESLVAASHVGLNFTARHASGFEISTGIGLTTIVDKFEYTYSYVVNDVIDQVTTVGEELFLEPQIEIIYRTFVGKKFYSKYRYLEIPLTVGYHVDAGRFNFGINSGIFASFLTNASGKISDISGENDIEIANGTDDRFAKKAGLGYTFGMKFGYDLHPRVALSFSPVLKYNPTDYSSTTQSVSQKQLLIGGHIGLNIQLDR